MAESVRVIRPDQRTVPEGAQTPGMVREAAVAAEGLWVGWVRTTPETFSGWHHHGEYDTYAYVLSGSVRIEFGPGGAEAVEASPGDFLHIPKRAIHREGNPRPEEAHVVLFRAGTGPALFNVDGPEA